MANGVTVIRGITADKSDTRLDRGFVDGRGFKDEKRINDGNG
jgi:hypothetical protein